MQNTKLLCSAILLHITMAIFAQEATSPNIIYILMDDLGYGELSCYGQTKIKTPNIDRLAQEGMKFTQHYAGNTVCSPSRAVLMTGQHPGHVYLRGNINTEVGTELDMEMTVLPEILKNAGYATGIFGKWGLGKSGVKEAATPLSHGFDEFCGWKSQRIAHTYYPSTMIFNGLELKLDSGTYIHDKIMNQAMSFMKQNADRSHPFFCYIPTAIPHAAMQAPKELHEKWRKEFPEFDHVIGKYSAGRNEYCPDVINPVAGFAAMMEHFDRQVGEILQFLKDNGIDKNTIIMLASDNGAHAEGGHNPEFWNSTGGLRGQKRDMHEGGIRSPFLVRWPGVVQPGTESELISAFWDVMPTLAEITHQPIPKQCDGISLLPELKGEKQKEHKYLYWEFNKNNNQKLFSQAVRKDQYKAYLEVGKPMEVYDLSTDPFEEHDLAHDNPKLVQQMQKIMTEAHAPLP